MKSTQEFTWKEQYEQKQTQYLSQLQQFSLHMLSMPVSEIDLTIVKEIEENPMVEFEEHAALIAGNEYNRNQIEQLAQTRTLFDELKQLALNHGCNMDVADLILTNNRQKSPISATISRWWDECSHFPLSFTQDKHD